MQKRFHVLQTKLKDYHRTLIAARPPAIIYKGFSNENKIPFTFAYIGTNVKYQKFWSRHILGQNHEKIFVEKNYISRALTALKRKFPQCAMVLCEESFFSTRCLKDRYILRIPQWLRLEVDLSHDPETRRWSRNNSFTRIRKKIQQQSLDYIITLDQSDWRNFYENMYVPYISSRFSDASVILPYSEMFDDRVPRELLLIRKNNKIIAGAVLNYWPNSPSMGWFGVINGDFNHVREGVFQAAYYFSAMKIRAMGFKGMNIGGSRPIINDGVTMHKIRMLAKVSYGYDYPANENLLMVLLRDTDGLRDFLLNNQIVGLTHDDQPYCASWIQPEMADSKARFTRSIMISNRVGFREHQGFLFDKSQIPSEWLEADSEKLLSIKSIDDYLMYNRGKSAT